MSKQLMMPGLTEATNTLPFGHVYTQLLMNVYDMIITKHNGVHAITNARTDHVCYTVNQGISFSFPMGRNLNVPFNRRYYPHTAAAEAAWFVLGTQKTAFIKQYTSIWENFEDEPGIIKTAYGHRWRHHFGRDQLGTAVVNLAHNPSCRQTLLMAWDPAEDGLGNLHAKNVPCPFNITLGIVDNKLNVGYHIRSSDLFVGLPYDVMNTDLIANIIRCSIISCCPEDSELIDLKLGNMTVFIDNPHLYSVHEDLLQECLTNYTGPGADDDLNDWTIPKPDFNMAAIESAPDVFVSAVKDAYNAEDVKKSQLVQKPFVAE